MDARPKSLLQLSVWLLVMVCAQLCAAEVAKTAHNLSAGPGKDGRPVNPCTFCHTPHNVSASRALWNRTVPGTIYKLYESPTLKARVEQPTGSSRLCLSCHDGTIALDENPNQPRPKAAGFIRGKASLTRDLSDDHPISFKYDSGLAMMSGELVDPALLPSRVRLDEAGQMQCTTCHNPHQDRNPKFLVMENRSSQLCRTCHQLKGWQLSVHATSAAAIKVQGLNPSPAGQYLSVAENGCANCHRVHSAGRPQDLLNFDTESKNCFACHNGSTSAKDVQREFHKFSAHPLEQSESIHNANEDPRSMPRHVACSDCHNAHTTQAAVAHTTGPARAPQGVRGVSSTGSRLAQATFEYEVCYRCHGVSEQSRTTVIRKELGGNLRLKFDPGNASFHPVVSPGKNQEISGLEPGYSPASIISCTDCHNSDNLTGIKGPHGSNYEPILEREYELQDPLPESYSAYALCYKCHNRAALLSDQSAFPHKLHVVDQQASCSVCHDAHGSRDNAHLINFMMRGRNGNSVVSPSSSGRLEFQSLGPSQGRCYLRCHGADHDGKSFPVSRQTMLPR